MKINKTIDFLRSIPKSIALKSRNAAWVMFFISIVMTIWLLLVIKEESMEKAKAQFDFQTQDVVASIKKRMEAYELVLHGGAGLFAASGQIKRSEWKTYVEKLQIEKNYPGILGVGFSKIVSPEKKDNLIKKVQKEGFPNFNIWPEGEREIYSSIIFLEPFKGRNLRAFGYDMFSDTTRRIAMEKARDSSKTFVSGKVKLVQETEKNIQYGFLMYEPIYNTSAPINSVSLRRQSLVGFVYSPFRMNDLITHILANISHDMVSFKIFDGEKADSSSLMFYTKNTDNTQIPAFNKQEKILLNGRTWTIQFSSLPAIQNLVDKEKPLIVLIAGSVISLLFLIVALALYATSRLYKKSEQILSSTNEGIFGMDLKNNCTFINKSAVKLIGYNPRTEKGKNIHEIVHDSITNEKIKKEDQCPICIALNTKKSYVNDNYIFKSSNGKLFPVQYSSNPIIEHGKVKGAVVSFQDITERKNSEKMIKDSLKEKDILIKEIHHRVKNNMQIISSMLNLQSNNVDDERALRTLRDSQNRIQSMAIIHEKLYRSGDLSGIKLDEYIKDLVNHLETSHNILSDNIIIKQKIDDVFLGIDTAITIGLIINELLSNIFKHAFTKTGRGIVEITYQSRGEMPSILSIKDNGKGFPKEFNFEQTESLGLQLVSTLVKQLNGTIKLNRNPGTEFIISLPKLS